MRTCIVLLMAAFVAASLSAADRPSSSTKEYFVFFGTYTKGKSKGIYRARFDAANGRLGPVELAAECRDPSFLALHPGGRFLYAIDEASDPVKTPGRGVSGFAIDGRTGALSPLNSQSVGGPGPCHLAVDHTGRCVVVANYSAGSVAALPLAADGTLGAAASVRKHSGSSVNAARQKQPHAHIAAVSPDNRYVLAADLGADKVFVYRLEPERALLTPHEPAAATLPPGSGPRHIAFHPNGRFVYVINELLCTIAAFRFGADGALGELQVISTLPAGESVQRGFSTAEIAVHPSGRFLYGSNRGHDSIAVYAIDAKSGRLTLVQHEPTRGRTPRHFALDPTGTWLLAENQDSDSVVVFRIDAETGRLTATGPRVQVPSPVCAVFSPVQ